MATTVPDRSDRSDRSPAPDEAGTGAGAGGGAEAAGERRGPGLLAAIAGALCLVYVLWYVIDLIVLAIEPSTFNATHDAADNVGMRLVFAVLFLAIAYHGLDGLRRTLVDVRPSWAAHDTGLRGAVAFLTMAAWIPVTVLVLWPSVRGWGA